MRYSTQVCDLCKLEEREDWTRESWKSVVIPSGELYSGSELYKDETWQLCPACRKVYDELIAVYVGQLRAFVVGRKKA